LAMAGAIRRLKAFVDTSEWSSIESGTSPDIVRLVSIFGAPLEQSNSAQSLSSILKTISAQCYQLLEYSIRNVATNGSNAISVDNPMPLGPRYWWENDYSTLKNLDMHCLYSTMHSLLNNGFTTKAMEIEYNLYDNNDDNRDFFCTTLKYIQDGAPMATTVNFGVHFPSDNNSPFYDVTSPFCVISNKIIQVNWEGETSPIQLVVPDTIRDILCKNVSFTVDEGTLKGLSLSYDNETEIKPMETVGSLDFNTSKIIVNDPKKVKRIYVHGDWVYNDTLCNSRQRSRGFVASFDTLSATSILHTANTQKSGFDYGVVDKIMRHYAVYSTFLKNYHDVTFTPDLTSIPHEGFMNPSIMINFINSLTITGGSPVILNTVKNNLAHFVSCMYAMYFCIMIGRCGC